jgi:hypothetical protein
MCGVFDAYLAKDKQKKLLKEARLFAFDIVGQRD